MHDQSVTGICAVNLLLAPGGIKIGVISFFSGSIYFQWENIMPASRTGNPDQSRFLRLRKEALDTAVAANRIVCRGLLQKADQDIRVLSEAVQVGLELVLPSAWSERLLVSDTKGSKSDALMRAGTLLFRSARDTVAIATETRSELHRLIWGRLKETIDLIGTGNAAHRHGDDDAIPHKNSSYERPPSKAKRKPSTAPSPKASKRGSRPKTHARAPGRQNRIKVDGTAAHGSSATRKSPTTGQAIEVDKASQQNARKPAEPSEE